VFATHRRLLLIAVFTGHLHWQVRRQVFPPLCPRGTTFPGATDTHDATTVRASAAHSTDNAVKHTHTCSFFVQACGHFATTVSLDSFFFFFLLVGGAISGRLLEMAFKSTAFLSFLLMLACATFFFSFNTAPQPPKQSVDCFCDLARTRFWLKELLVDSAALDRSVANPSSASRLRRFFGKVLAREPVKVAVLGGSISAPPSDGRATYADLFFNWFLQRAPRPINGTHTIVNGAIPATGSSFFR